MLSLGQCHKRSHQRGLEGLVHHIEYDLVLLCLLARPDTLRRLEIQIYGSIGVFETSCQSHLVCERLDVTLCTAQFVSSAFTFQRRSCSSRDYLVLCFEGVQVSSHKHLFSLIVMRLKIHVSKQKQGQTSHLRVLQSC